MDIQTTLRNDDLEAIAQRLTTLQDLKLDAIVPANALISDNGKLLIAGMGQDGPAGGPGEFTPTSIFDGDLAEKTGIPVKYLRRLRTERPDILDQNINGWLQGAMGEDGYLYEPDARKFMVRTFTDPDGGPGVARALLSNSYKRIDNLDVLTSVLKGISDAGIDAEVASCDLSETRMRVRIAAPGVRALAPRLLKGYRSPFGAGGMTRAGRATPDFWRRVAEKQGIDYDAYGPHDSTDIVFAGFDVNNGETGGCSFTIIPVLLSLVCRNGAVMAQDMYRNVHLGAKLEEGVINWSSETQERNLELVSSQAKDAVTTFLAPEYIQKTVDRIEEKADKAIEDPGAVVELIGQKLRYSEDETKGILDAFIRGSQMTAGGILNAVTAFSQTIDSFDAAYEMEMSAMDAFELATTV